MVLHILSLESAKYPLGHARTHLPVVGSANDADENGHTSTHTLFTSSAYICGLVEHCVTHAYDLGSANVPYGHDVVHLLSLTEM